MKQSENMVLEAMAHLSAVHDVLEEMLLGPQSPEARPHLPDLPRRDSDALQVGGNHPAASTAQGLTGLGAELEGDDHLGSKHSARPCRLGAELGGLVWACGGVDRAAA